MPSFDLPTIPRLLLQAPLVPLQGRRFQPTGFPDVGAGVYTLPNGEEHLLVESAQSVANRLEAACWDEAKDDLVGALAGLPYVRVEDVEARFLTSSVLEAHRLNSVYIEKSSSDRGPFTEELKRAFEFDDKRPTSHDKVVRALARYDVGCLLHGVFLESISGTLRVPRALSGFIEAERVGRVQTGGVKNDRVQAKKDSDSDRTAKEGFGNVPFHRTEFVADHLSAYFNLDLEQIRGYRLGEEMTRLLYALAVFKIRRFLARGLRLRTACDFEAKELESRSGIEVPGLSEIEEALPGMIRSVAKTKVFADPAITVVRFAADTKKPGKAKT
jgi:CRISPR-associated protein Csb1